MKKTKTVFLLFLIFTLVICLCSCKSEEDGETTLPTESVTGTTFTAAPTDAIESLTEEQTTQTVSQTETVSEQEPTATEIQTFTQLDIATEPVEVSGVETVTDGNKTIVYPLVLKGLQKTFPVIVWANGTGCPTQTYLSLLQEIANGGYIVVADSSVMTADGKSQIDSINYIINKNSDSSSVFYGKVDTVNIGACGHSQGGRSCVNAAQADARIRCLVSISGASSAEEASGLKTPSLFLTGTNDLVVISSQWCKPSYDAVSGRAAYASLRGGIHTTCMTNPSKVSGYTLKWFDAYLKNDGEAKRVFENGGTLSTDSNWQDFQNKN